METNKKYTKTVNEEGKIAIFEKLEDFEQICVFSQDPAYVVGGEYVDDDSVDLELELSDYLLLSQESPPIIDNKNETNMTTKKTILIAALTSIAVNILLNWWGLVIFAAFLYFWIWLGRKVREVLKAANKSYLSGGFADYLFAPIALPIVCKECNVSFWKTIFPSIPSFSFRSPIVKK